MIRSGSAAGAIDDSASVWLTRGSWEGTVGSGAEGGGAGAVEAAPGLRLAALGANFLPVVFSHCDSAASVASQGCNSLLIKELKVAAALGAGALSVVVAGGCVDVSSTDIVASGLLEQVWPGAWLGVHLATERGNETEDGIRWGKVELRFRDGTRASH